MAITPAALFSPDPGHVTDFSQFGVADIFNRIAVQRANSLEQDYSAFQEPGEVDGGLPMPTGSPVSAAQMFQPEESPDLLPPPVGGTPADIGSNSAPLSPPSPAENYAQPAIKGTRYDDPADFMYQREARLDNNGKLAVYIPPAGDGGGEYEVAGITQKYQPREAARLRQLIESGQQDRATEEAKAFYRARGAPFVGFTQSPGLRLQITDSVHHRGEGGLRRILQRATGSDSQNYGELIGQLSNDPNALKSFHAARQAYEWEEVDRGRASRKKFRQGLQNRFDRAYQASMQY